MRSRATHLEEENLDPSEKYSLDEAHLKFAKQTNGKTWELLTKPNRSAQESAEMIEAAYTSLYHWRLVGTAVNLQRGEWLIARVFTVLGQAEPALRYAERCLDLASAHHNLMEDFDIAFAYEGMARALALNTKIDKAKKFWTQARAAGNQIADAEDKKIFDEDFAGGDWYGVK
jgi:hypothetical protein